MCLISRKASSWKCPIDMAVRDGWTLTRFTFDRNRASWVTASTVGINAENADDESDALQEIKERTIFIRSIGRANRFSEF